MEKARRWGWIKRRKVREVMLRYNRKEDVDKIIGMLVGWRLCFESGEYLVWPLRFTSIRWTEMTSLAEHEAGQRSSCGPNRPWTLQEALETLFQVGDASDRKVQGVVLSAAGGVAKIPPPLFSMVMVQLCGEHGYRMEEELESYQEQVVLWRGQGRALMTFSLAESCIRVVVCGPAAAEDLLEIVVAFKEAQEQHFSIVWRYGILCGHCLLDSRCVEDSTIFVATLEKRCRTDDALAKKEWYFTWKLEEEEKRCRKGPRAVAVASTLEQWVLHGYPLPRQGEDALMTLLRWQLPKKLLDDFVAFLGMESLEKCVSKHRTWMSRCAIEVVVKTFPAVVRLLVGFNGYGSGFLGRNKGRLYLVTAYHVVKEQVEEQGSNVEVTLSYTKVGIGRSHPLAEVVNMDGMVADEGLDVAVFPVAMTLAAEVHDAALELSQQSVVSGQKLCIIHHPGGDAAAVDAGAKVTAVDSRRVHYSLETAKGSSGAPVFTVVEGSAKMVAVHLGGNDGRNYGVPMTSVMGWLEPLLP